MLTDALQMFQRIELGFSFLLSLITIALIICHRVLRKQHHIFSCNIALADLLGIVTLISKDVVSSTTPGDGVIIICSPNSFCFRWFIFNTVQGRIGTMIRPGRKFTFPKQFCYGACIKSTEVYWKEESEFEARRQMGGYKYKDTSTVCIAWVSSMR